MNVAIEAVGSYTPKLSLQHAELFEGKLSVGELKRLQRILGIKSIRCADRAAGSFTMACEAAKKCLRNSQVSPDAIDLVIYCSVSLYSKASCTHELAPSLALRLRHACGIHAPIVLNINNACAGMFTGIQLAKQLMDRRQLRSALIVSGELISDLGQSTLDADQELGPDTLPNFTMSDGAAAVMLVNSEQPNGGIKELTLKSFPQHASLCIGRIGVDTENGSSMRTHPQELYAATEERFYGLLDEVLAVHHTLPSADSWWIMHQASEAARHQGLQILKERYGEQFTPAHFVWTYQDYGNTASTTHFIALDHMLRNGALKAPFSVIFGIQASGLQLGCALVDFEEQRVELQPSREHLYLQFDHPMELADIQVIKSADPLADVSQLAAGYGDSIERLVHLGIDKAERIVEPAVASLIAEPLQAKGLLAEHFLSYDINDGACGLLKALAFNGDQTVLAATEGDRCAVARLKRTKRGITALFSTISPSHEELWRTEWKRRNGVWETVTSWSEGWKQRFASIVEGAIERFAVEHGRMPGRVVLPQCAEGVTPDATLCLGFTLPFFDALKSVEADTLVVAVNSGGECVAVYVGGP